MDVREIPLDQLHFGHEASIPINARKVGRDVEIDSLAASLLAHGLGQPLNVRELDGLVYVVDGNRRLAALYLNRDAGSIPADHLVTCNFDANGYSDELSLALNFQRVAMHPADEYEKFQELRTRGLTEDEIAGRFGVEPKRVRRMAALGQLHPDILAAWRADEIRQPIEVVRAFTLARSQEEQKEVFDRLNSNNHLVPHLIRDALGAGDREAVRLLTFVGREAYSAAGGAITEDLFGDNHAISNVDLLKKLVDDRIEAECTKLTDEGWSWSEVAASLPDQWNWNWQKLDPVKVDAATSEEAAETKRLRKLIGKTDHWQQDPDQRAAAERLKQIESAIRGRSYAADEKTKSGAVVSIDQSGGLNITYGVVKPAAMKPVEVNGKPVEKGPPTISDAMMQRLSVQLTKAAKDAIVATPIVALAAVIAGMSGYNMYGGVPVRLRAEGMLKETRPPEAFEAVFARLLKLSTDELLSALAAEACFTLDMNSHNSLAPPLGKPSNASLVDALDQAVLQEALRARFDAEDYFKTVPRSFTVAAIREAINDDEARKADKLKKGELVAFAVANVPKTGWLPVELRTASYAGPGAVKAAKPSRKKAA